MANQRPNPNEAFPNPKIPSLCYIKNVVKNPRIIIGDYTYYDDVDGADQFEKHVTHFYDFIANYISIAMAKRYWFWLVSLYQRLSERTRFVSFYKLSESSGWSNASIMPWLPSRMTLLLR